MSRLNRFVAASCCTLLGLIAVAALAQPAVAQAPQASAPDPYTYVAEWTIARDQWQGYSEWGMKNHKPIFERLAADGTLLDWGMYETYIHTEGGNTHGMWWTAANFAGIEKTRQELLKAPFHPAAAAGAHRDYLLRARIQGHHSGTVSGGFLYVNMQELRPGQGADWLEFWEKNTKPVFDDQVAKGALVSYVVHYEDVHTASNALRYIVTVSNSPAAEDQIEAAMTAAGAKRSEAEQEAMGRLMRDMTVPEGHRDYMARITAAWFK
jgi:hypothetical protein